jgi:predicted aminopeptidase
MNNARLGTYHTYMKDLSDFEKVYDKTGRNIPDFLKKCKLLNDVDDPELELKKWASE